MSEFATPHELIEAAGTDLGVSEWITVDQKRIDQFAECTEDRQWIHVDAERAENGPFGTTIAHGYLTLSLLPPILTDVVQVREVNSAVNYGLNKVRFPSPVPSGARIRGHVRLASAEPKGPMVMAVFGVTIEIEGGTAPGCVAEAVVLYA